MVVARVAVHTELFYADHHVCWLALIKRSPVLDNTRSVASQVQCVPLPAAAASSDGSAGQDMDGSGVSGIYESLHAYIHHAVSPFFNALVGAQTASHTSAVSSGTTKSREDKDGRQIAKKKLAELELSLLHLQQNVEIPEVVLPVQPVIQQTIDKASILLFLNCLMIFVVVQGRIQATLC